MEGLSIAVALFEEMIAHCKSAYPHEACGLLAGRNGMAEQFHPMSNVDVSSVSYRMDPQEQFRVMKEIRLKGQEMVAIVHSHPVSPPYPSQRDISLAFYEDPAYVIVSLIDIDDPVAKAFEIKNGRVREIQIRRGH